MSVCSKGSRQESQQLKPLTVTVKTALELLGIGRTTIYDLIDQGVVKTTKVGRRRLVLYSSLEAVAGGSRNGPKRRRPKSGDRFKRQIPEFQ